jgi:Zn finger protein HypA/HybF involved in hydrogenase expression
MIIRCPKCQSKNVRKITAGNGQNYHKEYFFCRNCLDRFIIINKEKQIKLKNGKI